MQNAVTREIAAEDIAGWLDHKRVKKAKREENQAAINMLIEGVETGDLVVNEDKSITHRLIFPILDKDGNEAVKTLTYRPRVQVSEVQKLTGNAKTVDERINATVAAITGEVIQMIGKLDTEDNSYAQSIAVFFI